MHYLQPIEVGYDPDVHVTNESAGSVAYVSGEQPINIDPARTRVIINETAEPECGRCIHVLINAG